MARLPPLGQSSPRSRTDPRLHRRHRLPVYCDPHSLARGTTRHQRLSPVYRKAVPTSRHHPRRPRAGVAANSTAAPRPSTGTPTTARQFLTNRPNRLHRPLYRGRKGTLHHPGRGGGGGVTVGPVDGRPLGAMGADRVRRCVDPRAPRLVLVIGAEEDPVAGLGPRDMCRPRDLGREPLATCAVGWDHDPPDDRRSPSSGVLPAPGRAASCGSPRHRSQSERYGSPTEIV